MKKRILTRSLLLSLAFFAIVIGRPSYAQTLPSKTSAVDVNSLSDDQIRELIADAQRSGMSEAQMVEAAKAKGFSDDQIKILSDRIAKQKVQNVASNAETAQQPRKVVSSGNNPGSGKDAFDSLLPRVFGSDLFDGSSSTFEPNLRIATPINYVLGPDDQININVFGNSVVSWKLSVTPEGNISIPGVGVINVAGKTVEQATSAIKTKLAANNYAIGRGTSVQVSLGDIRSIKVIINGEVVRPGTYTLPSLATVFNALSAAGGPNRNGSFRQIEVIRDNKIIRRLDVYDFLVKGDQKNNIGLRDQDIIRVPTYRVRVELAGEVKRPALYETLPGETLQDLIGYAGGFTDIAFTQKIQVLQISGQQRSITDVIEDDFKNYTPLRGDKYTVGRILESFTNRVTINGAVLRPGNYELDKGLTVSKLIAKASGLRPDAFTLRGTISRLRADNSPVILSFNVANIINKSTADIPLLREDVVTISANSDLRDASSLSINGQVRRPGTFAYADSMSIEDLILRAGGLTDAADAKRIEVSRRMGDPTAVAANGSVATVYDVTVAGGLELSQVAFRLRPFDIVSVYAAPGYQKQVVVKIEGEVLYPGSYTLKSKNERVSDLVKRAGGLTPYAYVEGGTLKRQNDVILGYDKNKVDTNALINERADQRRRISAVKDSSIMELEQLRNNYVGIDLKKILDDPGKREDLILEEGDVIRIPKELQTVRVNGETLYPSAVVYQAGKTFKGYVINAGGFSDYAHRSGSYVVYPNGTVKGTRKFLFFNSYPSVKPGSEIYIPKKQVRRGLSTQEVIGLTSGAVGIGAIILGIISLSR